MESANNVINEVMNFDSELKQRALYYTHNEADADDLVQETYLKVLQFGDRFEENTNLKAWTFTIMYNTFVNDYRRKKRRQTMFDDTPDSHTLTTVTDPCDAADIHYYVNDINKKITSIKEEQRKPFEMYLDGYKYQEIAEIMGISIGTVKSRIYFLRQKLMVLLEDYVTPTSYTQSA